MGEDSFLLKPYLSPEEFRRFYKHRPLCLLGCGFYPYAVMLSRIKRAWQRKGIREEQMLEY